MHIAPQKFKKKADGRIEIYIHGKNALSAFFHVQAKKNAYDNEKRRFQKLYGEEPYIGRRRAARGIDESEAALDAVAAAGQKTADAPEGMCKGKRRKHCGRIVHEAETEKAGCKVCAQKAEHKSAVIHKAGRVFSEKRAAFKHGKDFSGRIGDSHVRNKRARKPKGKGKHKKDKRICSVQTHPAHADKRKGKCAKDAERAHYAVGCKGNAEERENRFHALKVRRAYAQHVFMLCQTRNDIGIGGVGGEL